MHDADTSRKRWGFSLPPPRPRSILYLFPSIQLRPCNHQSYILPAHTIPSCHFTSCLPISYLSYPRGFYIIIILSVPIRFAIHIGPTVLFSAFRRYVSQNISAHWCFSPICFVKRIGPLALFSAFRRYVSQNVSAYHTSAQCAPLNSWALTMHEPSSYPNPPSVLRV